MRVVLDTNILALAISGPSGPATEVLRLVVAPPHVLLLSQPILSELSRVLRYERLRRLHRASDAVIHRYLGNLVLTALVVDNAKLVPPGIVASDPEDDLIIATAIAANADVICTRDRHFEDAGVVSFCRDHGIRLMSDVELLKLLREEGTRRAA